MESIIRIDNIYKTYHLGHVAVEVLRGLNIDIKKGEFVAIMGPSGSGKSTTMNMVGCLDLPTTGHIYLDGKDISQLEESELAQIRGKKIGFVFQMFNLIPSLTAKENVMLPMVFQGMDREKRENRALELLKKARIEKRAEHKPSELSGGEQQRVSIARALANDPEIILADEPTGNLDSITGREIMNLFSSLHKDQKKTIIIITHDSDIAKYAKRIINLRDGRIA